MTEDLGRGRVRWRLLGADLGLVALTLCPPVLMQPNIDTSPRALWLVAAYEAVGIVALMARRRFPVTVFLVVVSSLVAVFVTGAAEGARLSPLLSLPLAVALYGLGNSCTNWVRTGLAVLAAGVLVGAGAWINRVTAATADLTGGSDVIAVLAPMPLAWAIGSAARTHRIRLVGAARRVADMRREQQRREDQAAQQERVRLAREMHDVVAHSLTLLVVRAETLRARGGDLPVWARTEIDGLAMAGRQAGGELRDLLKVLRGSEETAPLQPTPGLRDLAELLSRSRAAGARVDARIDADPDVLSQPLQLAAYRIVQEGLTNVGRHAPGARVRVTVTEDSGLLRCEVVNTRPQETADGTWGAGLGLVSMKERAEALGGQVSTGPTAEGGFQVVAVLPTASARLDAADV
ncbi:sensor histidine kinase [Streptomyces sp. NPDC006012]|uniref:sensor histidine kinase n=1 Tax=Streptomyces sp. NPDC006012 TaxID=3364739 RepID=UPI00368BA905